MAEIPNFFDRWLKSPWRAGDGLHSDIFTAANYLLESGFSEEQTLDAIRSAALHVDERSVPDRELVSAVKYALAKKQGLIESSPKWEKSDQIFMSEVVRNHPVDLDFYRDTIRNLEQNPSSFLPHLFRMDELVCAASDTWNSDTMTRDEIVEISKSYRLEFVVPSAMTAKVGTTLDGRESPHTKSNTGPRIYQVVEFDQATVSDQFSFHSFLSTKFPLVLILHSGGKSVHGWYLVEGQEEHKVREFFNLACVLGADKKTWSPTQFVRMPGGYNNKHLKKQQVAYFQPTRNHEQREL